MAPKKLHHVAVAVDSVDEALKFYRETLGLAQITIMTLEDRGLKVGLVKAGPSEIELLEPLQEDSTVGRFLDRRGPGLHHVCFEVEDVEKSMRYYEGRGATFIDPVPRPGAVGLVSFMPPTIADGVLVELAQTSGYTFPEPEAEAADEDEAAAADILAPAFHVPTTRGAAGYSRHGLVNAAAWGQMAAPATPTEPEPAAEPTPPIVANAPLARGTAGYTRAGLGAAASSDWPAQRAEASPAPALGPKPGPEPEA
jgi:methylmalonyl-CoA epimerase